MPKTKEIFLPRTEIEFEALIKTLVKKYKLPNEDHATVVVCNRIMHMPPDQATTTLEYLGNCILKNMSYQLAQSVASKVNHKLELDHLEAHLKNNPFDQQALDAVEKAAKMGSQQAQALLDLYTTRQPAENVSSITNALGK